MWRHKSTPSSSVKKYIQSPEQKENDKYPENNPEDTEIYNLNDNEFKIDIIKKLNEIKENTDRQFNEFRSYVTKELDTIKKNQYEMLEMKKQWRRLRKIWTL